MTTVLETSDAPTRSRAGSRVRAPPLASERARTDDRRALPPGPRVRLTSRYHEIEAGDGDRLSVLESTPEGWAAGDPAALLVHGLAGCARSPYVVRVAARLVRLGVRAVRMNLRGAGSGFGGAGGILPRRPHRGPAPGRRMAGAPVHRLADRPASGFSLGAQPRPEAGGRGRRREPLDGLDCVLAANPPLDLAACCRHIQRRENRIYDRNFLRLLRAEVARLHAAFPDLARSNLAQRRDPLRL